jgi:hypothetical protein
MPYVGLGASLMRPLHVSGMVSHITQPGGGAISHRGVPMFYAPSPEIAARIAARRAARIAVESAAEIAGMTPRTVRLVEGGRLTDPDVTGRYCDAVDRLTAVAAAVYASFGLSPRRGSRCHE